MKSTKGLPSNLYESLAKDFNPKVALMNLCRHVQETEAKLEAQAAGAEARIAALEQKTETPNTKSKEAVQK